MCEDEKLFRTSPTGFYKSLQQAYQAANDDN